MKRATTLIIATTIAISTMAQTKQSEITVHVRLAGKVCPTNHKIGNLRTTIDGKTADTSFDLTPGKAKAGKLTTLKIPFTPGKPVTLCEGPGYTGYDLTLTHSGQTVTELTLDQIPQKGTTVTATFTANGKQNLFYTIEHDRPYRIPAIAKANNGDLIAISDDRFCGADIGYGRVDLVYKVSHDNGKTWSAKDIMLAQGNGHNDSNTCGYGDAAVCADRSSDKIMLMAVSAPNGGTCWTAKQRGVITWGNPQPDGTYTWDTPIDIKDEIMSLLPSDRINYFVGSGKISQSRIIKKGDYYRVYVALWTTNGSAGDGLTNYVIYSDHLGKPGTWHLLGEKNVRPIPGGDEPKAEELPDGSIILSGRKSYGRYYNIFRYTDATHTTGTWSTPVATHDVTDGLKWGANSTNGEIMVIKARHKHTGLPVHIALQSAPAGNSRSHVTIWYKILNTIADYINPETFSQHWTKGIEVTPYGSAYSTMCLQADNKIAFFFEDSKSGAGYDMVYQPIALDQLAGLEDYVIY